MPMDYTKDSIRSALISLLNERPLHKISVKSIADQVGISRNTFYYHFKSVPDLLEQTMNEAAERMIREHPTANSMEECILGAYAFVRKNPHAVEHIYHSADRGVYEDFVIKMCDHTAHVLAQEYMSGSDITPEEQRLMTYFIKCELLGMCIDWSKNGMNDDIVGRYHLTVDAFTQMSRELLAPAKNFSITNHAPVS